MLPNGLQPYADGFCKRLVRAVCVKADVMLERWFFERGAVKYFKSFFERGAVGFIYNFKQ